METGFSKLDNDEPYSMRSNVGFQPNADAGLESLFAENLSCTAIGRLVVRCSGAKATRRGFRQIHASEKTQRGMPSIGLAFFLDIGSDSVPFSRLLRRCLVRHRYGLLERPFFGAVNAPELIH